MSQQIDARLLGFAVDGMSDLDRLCAYAEQLEDERDHWRGQYYVAHAVLVHVAEFVDRGVWQGKHTEIDLDLYRAMAASFAAYRQSIEAGAPVAWAVGVDA